MLERQRLAAKRALDKPPRDPYREEAGRSHSPFAPPPKDFERLRVPRSPLKRPFPTSVKSALHSRGGRLRASAACPCSPIEALREREPPRWREAEDGLDERETLRESGVFECAEGD